MTVIDLRIESILAIGNIESLNQVLKIVKVPCDKFWVIALWLRERTLKKEIEKKLNTKETKIKRTKL